MATEGVSKSARYARRNRALGLCRRCSQPAVLRADGKPGGLCAKHKAEQNKRKNETRRQNAALARAFKRAGVTIEEAETAAGNICKEEITPTRICACGGGVLRRVYLLPVVRC